MVKPLRKKARNIKRFYAVTLFVVLLAAAGAGLYRLPPSLLDVGKISRLAADKFSSQSADKMSAEAVLRGTIFDRNLNELAVSYQLYTLYVRPSEIADRHKVVSALSDSAGLNEGDLDILLSSGGSLIKIAENLEQPLVDEIRDLRLAGVYCKPVEERYYPEHEVAADLIGYTGEGTGLAGVEGSCDTILQRGDFKATSIPEIDFRGSPVLGSSKLNIVLTLDLEIQKQIEHGLRDYLVTHGTARGLALVINARTGAILAWANNPSFDPNYFWQAPGTKQNSLSLDLVDARLYRDMLIRAAAARKMGELGGNLPPATLAAENLGLQENEILQYEEVIGLGDDALCLLPACTESIIKNDGNGSASVERSGISPLQFVTAAAGMLNGGWKVQPHVLDSIYDESRLFRYERSGQYDAAGRRRLMSPSMGILLRMNLPHMERAAADDIYLYTGSVADITPEGDLSRYVMQNMMIGAIPAKSPEFVVLMVTWQDHLRPLPADIKQDSDGLADFGMNVLPAVYKLAHREIRKDLPVGKDSANYNRFLISRRIDYQEEKLVAEQNGPVMPLVTGMSLRKGLQKLNAYNIRVKVEGSGRIVTQWPESGQPLNGVGECTLILESNI